MHPLIKTLDAIGDGQISAEEIDGAAAALNKLDRNGDGKLSRDELRGEGTPPFDGNERSRRPR